MTEEKRQYWIVKKIIKNTDLIKNYKLCSFKTGAQGDQPEHTH